MLQRAGRWMFPTRHRMVRPADDLKHHSGQLELPAQREDQDQLRQTGNGLARAALRGGRVSIPRALDEESGRYAREYDLRASSTPPPSVVFDEPITWDEVVDRWRAPRAP